MKRLHTYTPVMLRFRRWSRKRYAAFVSVQQTVTIGQLSANVSERFQAKNTSLHSIARLSDSSCHAQDDTIDIPDAIAGDTQELLQAIIESLQVTAMQSVAAAVRMIYIFTLSLMGEISDVMSVISFFYVYN